MKTIKELEKCKKIPIEGNCNKKLIENVKIRRFRIVNVNVTYCKCKKISIQANHDEFAKARKFQEEWTGNWND